jgi:hypothetical protein
MSVPPVPATSRLYIRNGMLAKLVSVSYSNVISLAPELKNMSPASMSYVFGL